MSNNDILKSIKNGEKYTKSCKKLIPLVRNGLIEIVEKENPYRIISAKLTKWGESCLKFEG